MDEFSQIVEKTCSQQCFLHGKTRHQNKKIYGFIDKLSILDLHKINSRSTHSQSGHLGICILPERQKDMNFVQRRYGG